MKSRKLNRDSNARFALFRGLAASIIDKEEIKTTSAKARAVRSLVEKLISKARVGTIHARRQVQAEIQDSALVSKLFTDIAPRYTGIKGGFTKLTVVGNRKGDNAPIVKLALTKKAAVAAPANKANKTNMANKAKSVATPAPKVVAPKAVKSTRTAKMAASKAGMVRKTGER